MFSVPWIAPRSMFASGFVVVALLLAPNVFAQDEPPSEPPGRLGPDRHRLQQC